MLSSLDAFAEKHPPAAIDKKGFGLKVLATSWGFSGTVDAFCAKAKGEGYEGIEMWWPGESSLQNELFAALKKHGLDVGFLCGSGTSNHSEHLAQFKKATEAAANNKVQRPLYINCHSGKDYFSFEENGALIEHTTRLAKETGLLICHETHRSRLLFAAPVAKKYLQTFPQLKITLDASHWCNVSESLLHDQPETMKLAVAKTEHIHARIGHSQGPQVNDPRAPEWGDAVKAHLRWWDEVVERKKKNGEQLTILTEFGPPDYMPTTPYTRQPLADQWAINVHMMHLLRKRYS